ncbi:MAG: hypothetical protein NWQ54_06510 [Paraglaciecola sp.]|uniref:hypothetical protein n=1 Tax=Pseudomonadati TaxID=3379134 RepID=UPI00273D8AFF|nr:hypothetical protein [Paraglaciecola sp.]MDP5030069.1 hypothetical protein [Paraglaciecola sp.]MDP5130518.1 hypothetical protein [Paraglaciecola sp.]
MCKGRIDVAAVLLCLGLTACEQSSVSPKGDEVSINSSQNRKQQTQSEAKADALLAIKRQDFRLLALRNKGTTLPGIDLQRDELSLIEQQCGLIFMQNSGDVVLNQSELTLRQEQFAYALIYNKTLLPACLQQDK